MAAAVEVGAAVEEVEAVVEVDPEVAPARDLPSAHAPAPEEGEIAGLLDADQAEVVDTKCSLAYIWI